MTAGGSGLRDLRRTDLGLLAALDALLEERSVTRAAARLAVTQPTVSGMLARLRRLFGDPLFVRTQRGLLPTPRALALAPGLKQWLTDAGALVAGPAFEPVSARWTTAIAANDYIQSALIVPFLERLGASAPHARVAVRPAQTDRVADTLANGELDLNITGTTETPSYDLHSRMLYEERYVGVVRDDHPLSSQRPVSLDGFCSYPHVLVSPTEGRFAGPTDQALARLGRARRVMLSVPGFLVLPDILQTGDLIAVVPERVLRGRLAGLRTFTPPLMIPTFSVVELWHARLHRDPAHRWLRELLAATAMLLRTPQSTPA
jgi:DNA-binding transcriptional LysR family regulator